MSNPYGGDGYMTVREHMPGQLVKIWLLENHWWQGDLPDKFLVKLIVCNENKLDEYGLPHSEVDSVQEMCDWKDTPQSVRQSFISQINDAQQMLENEDGYMTADSQKMDEGDSDE